MQTAVFIGSETSNISRKKVENGVTVTSIILAVCYCCMKVALQVLLPLWSILNEIQ